MTRPPIVVGDIVHVLSAGKCRAAVVVDAGPVLQRVRVFSLRDPRDDEIGDVAHWTDLRLIPNPPDVGGVRVLDSWHDRWMDCDQARASVTAAVAGVVGS